MSWARTPRAVRSSLPAEQPVAQHDRLVVLGVLRVVEQHDRPVAQSVQRQLCRVGPRVELGAVALAEPVPALGIVAEPAAELGARRHVLQPAVDVERVLAYATRPQPIHQIGRRLATQTDHLAYPPEHHVAHAPSLPRICALVVGAVGPTATTTAQNRAGLIATSLVC